MKKRNSWKIRAGAFCLTAVCLGTGAALAAEAGGEGDPLVTRRTGRTSGRRS